MFSVCPYSFIHFHVWQFHKYRSRHPTHTAFCGDTYYYDRYSQIVYIICGVNDYNLYLLCVLRVVFDSYKFRIWVCYYLQFLYVRICVMYIVLVLFEDISIGIIVGLSRIRSLRYLPYSSWCLVRTLYIAYLIYL